MRAVTVAASRRGPARDDAGYWTRRRRDEVPIRAVGYRSKSPGFNRWMYRARERTVGAVADGIIAGAGTDLRILDAGAGTGFHVELWRRRAPEAEVVGVDVSPEAVEGLRERFPEGRFVTAELGAGESLPVAGRYDVVQAHDVLYHITDDGRFRVALRQLADRVAPGGHLLVTDNFPSRDVTTRPHVRLRSPESYEETLRDFELVETVPQYLLLNVPSGIAAGWLRRPLVVLWEALTLPARWEPAGRALGALLYGADRLLLPLLGGRTPSTKLAHWRRVGEGR